MVQVKEIMKRFVYTVQPSATLAEVARLMDKNRIGSVVVTNKGKPAGIVTDTDIVAAVAAGKDLKKVRVKTVSARKFITASPTDDVLQVTRKMIKAGIKRVPIVKDGRLHGIVSDKEILLTTPELVEILSERLKMRVSRVAMPKAEISGICEGCEGYADTIKYVGGKWLCEDCRS